MTDVYHWSPESSSSEEENEFECDMCSRTFSLWQSCAQHMDSMEHRFTDECETCDRRFVNAHAAEQHMNALSHWEYPYCSTCDRCFECDFDLFKHMNSSIHRTEPVHHTAPAPILNPPPPASANLPALNVSVPLLTPNVTIYPNLPAAVHLPSQPSLPITGPSEIITHPPLFTTRGPARPADITAPSLPTPVTLYARPVPPKISTSTTTGFQRSNVPPPPIPTLSILPALSVQPKLSMVTATNCKLGNITPPPTPAPALTFGSLDSPSWPVARLVTARPAGPAPIPLPVFVPVDVSASTILPGPRITTLPLAPNTISTFTIISGPSDDTFPLLNVAPKSTVISGTSVETVPSFSINISSSAMVSGPTVDTAPYIPTIVKLVLRNVSTQTETSQSVSRSEIKSQQIEPVTSKSFRISKLMEIGMRQSFSWSEIVSQHTDPVKLQEKTIACRFCQATFEAFSECAQHLEISSCPVRPGISRMTMHRCMRQKDKAEKYSVHALKYRGILLYLCPNKSIDCRAMPLPSLAALLDHLEGESCSSRKSVHSREVAESFMELVFGSTLNINRRLWL
ncbi:hypothetical protein E4T47_07629 [Aureobasidium subglaciale]|nr:hypothetical protein E4T47_07629 [Aureobasidium subglaciale]